MASPDVTTGLRASLLGVAVNAALAIIKIATGVAGHSYALIADGIESSADILSSAIVWSGLRIAGEPPDPAHPYGHGKAESLAGFAVALALLGAAALIAIQAIHNIATPHQLPKWFTLPVLAMVIVAKEILHRRVRRIGRDLGSRALLGDAGHHRADALTSIAAFIGISIALIGGPGYESADDWAALFACVVIFYNGIHLLRQALHDVMDGAVPDELQQRIRTIASKVEGVSGVEKCRIRRSGLGLMMDIHVEVDGDMTVTESHRIAHLVRDTLVDSGLNIADVVVHIEPADSIPIDYPPGLK
jgi:cation diffusion facilitator family transporter